MINPTQVTIVVSCMNEEGTILKICQQLRQSGYNVLVPIAKMSSDRTREICAKNSLPHFIDSGKGKGCAVIESIERITTPYLVFFDADGSHEINDIGPMLEALELGNADIVIGSRLLGGSMELYDGTLESFFRAFFTLCINQLVNLRFGSRVTDTQNGFRAGKAESLRSLKLGSQKFEIETEMVMNALKKKMAIAEIPSREYRRVDGKSGISMVWDGWRYMWVVLSNMF
ncbi:hypothetical protein COT30_04880 [Candidatus Micrarchaeota archaeon CG08_land_8_20_14_0_20_49_17]|nr:MAG: hypothetical protein AUJ13_04820 [Candidatus Micrarchaeota archaeon CG1_02_49_24]PIU09335.1 MAG: hypothetical protein COT30_04880 [Candidatus Micrarchaeota archaeon CG08_land_8_20_14_0_20_49_17]PIU82232.1 MAG: hypothetical protein COS70_01925 [Candidatus Micrarchaeota archaeon CG06_land_8_20_14_3_00_50_6]PIZ92128.1 MAG: hypothetical protein COX84_07310 [Candidatus Micrarchaeota archaeon CG_4_10_14_0_2_um_filter_49_7]HII53350.1 glycosyltransferase [Candidatus Micrarchaeota archaeon]